VWGAKLPRDNAYYEHTRVLLERAYLEAGDPRGKPGFGGDEAEGVDTNGVVLTTELPET